MFLKKLAFWRSQTLLSITDRSVVKSYCPKWVYFWGAILGGGVNDSTCDENLDLAPKTTSTIRCWDKTFLGSIFFFKKLAFWRGQTLLSITGRSVVKSYCPKWVNFWGAILGGGVNDSICVENLDLAPKMTSTIWSSDAMKSWCFDVRKKTRNTKIFKNRARVKR